MTIAVKNNNKTPLVVPAAVRRKAGFKSGEELEIEASGGAITILPKLPSARDEYSASGRRAIDAELAKAGHGPFHGPFNSADEMIGDLKGRLSKSKSVKKSKPFR